MIAPLKAKAGTPFCLLQHWRNVQPPNASTGLIGPLDHTLEDLGGLLADMFAGKGCPDGKEKKEETENQSVFVTDCENPLEPLVCYSLHYNDSGNVWDAISNS